MKILFVCIGNICRSPAAEGVFKKILSTNGSTQNIEVDSAGLIDYHQGEPIDDRMLDTMKKRNYDFNHFARQITLSDFEEFDYILAVDNFVYSQLIKFPITPDKKKKILKLADYFQNYSENEIADPYYGNLEDFEYCLNLIEDSVKGFMKKKLNFNESKNLQTN